MKSNPSSPRNSSSPDQGALAEKPTESKEKKFSLSRLSAAFAQMTGSQKVDGSSSQQTVPERPGANSLEPSLKIPTDADMAVSPSMIIEGMLFVGDDGTQTGRTGVVGGLTSEQMSSCIRDVSPSEVDQLVQQLNQTYLSDNCPYEIVADSGYYRMQLREKFKSLEERFRSPGRAYKLTPVALEVLAIVAYRQPVTAEQVQQLRRTRSHAVLNQLVNRQLLQLERHDDKPRKPWYRTTERFNQLFQLQTLDDLPRNEDLDDN